MDYVIKRARKNGKNQVFITLKDGENDIHPGDYVFVRKVPENAIFAMDKKEE